MNEIEFKKSKVSIVIVTWNCSEYIRHTIESIKKQTMDDFDILVIDNASNDETVDILQNNFGDLVKIVNQKQNLGFSKGYNYGIHWTRGEYVLVMNQDVVLDKNFLEIATSFLDAEAKVAAIQGKIMHWDSMRNKTKNIIDTCGLVIHPNHRIDNLFEGEKLENLPADWQAGDVVRPIFGFSGSCVLLRRSALEQVRFENEFFDEDFFAYKEDADLSWRLRHTNWDIVYLSKAIAYHGRSLKGLNNNSNKDIVKHRKTKNSLLNVISYRNHLFMIMKNEYWSNIFYYFFSIFWYEFRKLGYIILFEQRSLKALADFLKFFNKMRRKRKQIMKKSKMPAEAFREWVN